MEHSALKYLLTRVSYLEQQNVTEPIGSGYSKRVHFLNVYISEEMGKHTLDAYINDNISTRNYCELYTTLIGIGTSIHPIWKFILDHYN